MKKVVSAILSSPLFVFRHETVADNDPYALASKLSFSLWGSCPDEGLLNAAEKGSLTNPNELAKVVDGMLEDPKIERFLDSFPSQWMQLENALAATPDPKVNRYFSIDKEYPASLAMVVEPLLLFDAIFVENRPIAELIKPSFAYRNEFLETWYHGELKPSEKDLKNAIEANDKKKRKIFDIEREIEKGERELATLIDPFRKRILAERAVQEDLSEPVDLRPIAAWEFNGNLKSSVGAIPLKKHGKAEFKDGMVEIGQDSYLRAPTSLSNCGPRASKFGFFLKILIREEVGSWAFRVRVISSIRSFWENECPGIGFPAATASVELRISPVPRLRIWSTK